MTNGPGAYGNIVGSWDRVGAMVIDVFTFTTVGDVITEDALSKAIGAITRVPSWVVRGALRRVNRDLGIEFHFNADAGYKRTR